MNNEIKEALDVLNRKGTILYPTDTVWGLGCDAGDSAAVRRLYSIKGKPADTAAIVLVANIDMLYDCVRKVPDVALDLLEVADGPLTLVLPGACGVAPEIVAADGTIGVRLVRHDYCAALIRAMRRPLVSTSANLVGQPTPKSFADIAPELLAAVDYAVDARHAGRMTGKPSPIIGIGLAGEVRIIRH